MYNYLINRQMNEVRETAHSFIVEIRNVYDEEEYQAVIARYKAVRIRMIENKHKFEIARAIESEIEPLSNDHIKLRWLYEPNATQLQDILDNQIKHLKIREYKKDIIKLIKLYSSEDYKSFEEEYSRIKEIDHQDEQSRIKWDGREDVANLITDIADEFIDYKSHLRLVIRIIAKQHTVDARNQIEKFIKIFGKHINNGEGISEQFAELYTETMTIHRIQIGDLEKVRDAFETDTLINNTKMDNIIHSVADLNAQFNNVLVSEALQGIKSCANSLTKEKGYEYFFRDTINGETQLTTNREGGTKRPRLN